MKTICTKLSASLWMILLGLTSISAQESISLDDVLASVLDNSYSVRSAANEKEIAHENYNFFKAQLKPSLSLRASIPNYSKTFSPVIQPDGTITFTSIQQANSSASLFATQVIAPTGGTLFLNSDIQRFDDLSFNSKQYNGNPIRVGIYQPLFGFNQWKYQAEIQNLAKEESVLNYNIKVEEALGTATNMYFNILLAKQNLEIANTNELVNEKLLTITEERLRLGKVSKDEKLQLEIELNNAKLSVSSAKFEVDKAISNLYTYLGKTNSPTNAKYNVPDLIENLAVDLELILKQSKINRPEILAYQREKKQANMDMAEAKANYGIQADMQVSIGLARGAEQFSEIYTDPFNEQQFNISILIPIVDWGKKKSATKQIEIQEREIEANYNQRLLELNNNITQRVYLFIRLQSELKILKEIMDKANERFNISNERYILGNIDISNLTLAQREKDQAKRNYYNALKIYWVTYHEIRTLSGFDILKGQKIQYQ